MTDIITHEERCPKCGSVIEGHPRSEGVIDLQCECGNLYIGTMMAMPNGTTGFARNYSKKKIAPSLIE